MRRVNLKFAAWCSALLVIAQLTTGPVAHALSDAMSCIGCTHVAAAGSPPVEDACADCPEAADQSPAGSHHDHRGGSCHCHCAQTGTHTPAAATLNLVALLPAEPEALSGEPKGPAFSAPQYEFLRPPN
jgi:hypothetical protein